MMDLVSNLLHSEPTLKEKFQNFLEEHKGEYNWQKNTCPVAFHTKIMNIKFSEWATVNDVPCNSGFHKAFFRILGKTEKSCYVKKIEYFSQKFFQQYAHFHKICQLDYSKKEFQRVIDEFEEICQIVASFQEDYPAEQKALPHFDRACSLYRRGLLLKKVTPLFEKVAEVERKLTNYRGQISLVELQKELEFPRVTKLKEEFPGEENGALIDKVIRGRDLFLRQIAQFAFLEKSFLEEDFSQGLRIGYFTYQREVDGHRFFLPTSFFQHLEAIAIEKIRKGSQAFTWLKTADPRLQGAFQKALGEMKKRETWSFKMVQFFLLLLYLFHIRQRATASSGQSSPRALRPEAQNLAAPTKA